MKKNRATAEPSSELRLLAEKRLKEKLKSDMTSLSSPQDMIRIIHELSLHQLELEMQQDELTHSRSELASAVDRYTELYNLSPLGYLTLDEKGMVLEANLTASTILGVDRVVLLKQKFQPFVAPQDSFAFSALMERIFLQKMPGHCEVMLLTPESLQGKTKPACPGKNIRLEAVPLHESNQCQITLSDISEIYKSNRALHAINSCNKALLHAESEEELLSEICNIIVDAGGYRMTWVGYAVDDAEKSVQPVATAGVDDGYLSKLKISWGENEHGQGPSGTAIRSGKPFTTRNIQLDTRFAPWREEAISRGYLSSLGLPLGHGNHVFGVLNIYSGMADAFTAEETELLASLADNLAYGITTLRTRKAREKSENELYQSEARYRSLFQNKYTVMLIVDPEDGRIVDANPAAVNFYGWTQEELCRMNISQINMLTAPEIKAEMQRAKQDERNYFIFRHQCRDGTIRDVEVVSGAIILEGKSLLYSIIHDVTERKRLQEELLASSQRMRVIMSATNSGIWENIPNTNIAVWSEEMWALMGLKPQSCQPSFDNWLKTIIPEDRVPTEKTVREAMKRGVEFNCIWRILDEKGSIRWLLSKGVPFRDSASTITRYVGIILDITEKRKEEEEKSALEALLRKSQRLEAIGTLAGGIAHDFNNILTPILGYSEMGYMNLKKEDPIREYFNEIMGAAERARNLVAQILTFSKDQESTPTVVSVQAVIDEALKLLRPSIPSTITIESRIEKSCPNILADSSKLHQLVINLCTNAFHAMEESGGVLTIGLKEITLDSNTRKMFPKLDAQNYLQLTVSDTGTGMDEETMERIFEPFFTTKSVNKGTGLGLSVVHGIVKSLKGEINVESRQGKGSTFIIYLPVINEEIPESEAEGAKAKGKGTVLLVDDEPAALKVLSLMIRKIGFNTDAQNSPKQALERFRTNPDEYDLVVTDLTMPEMTGFELAAAIHKTNPGTPIIMISGYGKNVDDQYTLEQYGIRKSLNKPVKMMQIASAIQELIPAAETGSN